MPKIKSYNCKECGNSFNDRHRAKARIYCSRACQSAYKSRASKVKRSCMICGQNMEIAKGQIDNGKNKGLYCSNKCSGLGRLGKDNPNYKKGRSIRENGYVTVFIEGNRVFEHRLVMEKRIGRALLAHENVHHINGDRSDNRDENLELWSCSQPSGQRITDKVKWAKEILSTYEPESLSDTHDRDVNAAKNILALGHQRLAVGIPRL